MLELITGAAGTGKSYEMMKRISEAVSEGKKVFAIVPDQFNFEYNRMLYDFMGMESFNKTEVVSFSRLAGYIFTEYGGLRGKYADDTVRSVIMFRALSRLNERGELSFYSKQAKNTRFISDALEFVKTFSLCGISPETLAERAEFTGDAVREKIKDISLIYSAYTDMLEEQGYKDSRTDISEAAKKAAEHCFFKGTDFFIDEFKSFTPDEYELLKIIIRGAESLTVCLTTDDTAHARFSVFETVNGTAAKLAQYAREAGATADRVILKENRRFRSPELLFLSRNILSSGTEKFGGECHSVRIFEAAEPYSEADFVCAEIKRLVSEENYRYSDIAVISRCKENYSSALEAAFGRGNIPFYSDEKQSITHKALIIFVSSALKIISSKSISTEDMLRYIKTGFTGLDTEQAGILEEYCYKWSVEGKMWLEPFRVFDKNSPEREEAAEKARAAVTAPLEKLRKSCEIADAAGICRALDDFLEETKVREQITAMIKENGTSAVNAAVTEAVRGTKQLWEALCALLQTLYRTLGDIKITAKEFSALFDAAALTVSLSSPPQTLDEVSFSASQTARFSNPRAVFVIGANEGILPFAAKSSPLLTDREIKELAKSGIEISGSSEEKLAEERFVAYASLSAASEKLYITYPSGDISGKSLYPSLTVKRAAEMFENDITLNAEKLGLLYFCRSENDGYYQYVQNFKRRDVSVSSLKKALEEFDPANREKFELLARAGAKNVHSLSGRNDIPKRLFGENISLSASRLEDYRLCPFMFFCKKGLRIFPAKKVRLDASARGNAVHSCLCGFLKSYDRSAFLALSEKELKEAVKTRLAEYYSSDEVGSSYGKTKRFRAAFDRLADTVSEILLNLQTEFSQSEFYPDSFEYTFGYDGDEKPVYIKIGGGGKVCFTGAVDRVDICDEGGMTYVRVVDYKTGRKTLSAEDMYYGINMQMLLYMFALTDPSVPVNQGLYHGALPAGVLYMPARAKEPFLPRDASPEETEKAKSGGRKMDGMVLADAAIVRAMEKDAAGVFIPAKIKNDGDFYKGARVLTEEQFNNLRKYSADILKDTAKGIKSGKIDALPLINKKKTPCAYCDYSSVCGNFPNFSSRVRNYGPDAKEKMQIIIDGEEEAD